MADHKAVNGKVINSLINAYFMGSSGLNELIELLRAVLNEEMWRDFIEDSTKEEKKFQSFSEFVQAPLPFGLGTDVKRA